MYAFIAVLLRRQTLLNCNEMEYSWFLGTILYIVFLRLAVVYMCNRTSCAQVQELP